MSFCRARQELSATALFGKGPGLEMAALENRGAEVLRRLRIAILRDSNRGFAGKFGTTVLVALKVGSQR